MRHRHKTTPDQTGIFKRPSSSLVCHLTFTLVVIAAASVTTGFHRIQRSADARSQAFEPSLPIGISRTRFILTRDFQPMVRPVARPAMTLQMHLPIIVPSHSEYQINQGCGTLPQFSMLCSSINCSGMAVRLHLRSRQPLVTSFEMAMDSDTRIVSPLSAVPEYRSNRFSVRKELPSTRSLRQLQLMSERYSQAIHRSIGL